MVYGPEALSGVQLKEDSSPVFSVTRERTKNHQKDVQTNLSKISEAVLTNDMTVILSLKTDLVIHQEKNKPDGLDWYALIYFLFFPNS